MLGSFASAFWIAEGRVLAGMSVNVWDIAEPIQALIASGSAVDERRLADPYVSLTELIAGQPAALEEVAP